MAELAVQGPLNKADLDNDLRLNPLGSQARQTYSPGERSLWYLEVIELRSQIEKQLSVKAGSNLPRKNKIVTVKVANQQGTQAYSFPLRIGKAANNELLGQLAFHLQPI